MSVLQRSYGQCRYLRDLRLDMSISEMSYQVIRFSAMEFQYDTISVQDLGGRFTQHSIYVETIILSHQESLKCQTDTLYHLKLRSFVSVDCTASLGYPSITFRYFGFSKNSGLRQ